MQINKQNISKTLIYGVLTIHSFLILYPLYLMFITGFKKGNRELFENPYGLPDSFLLDNFKEIIVKANFLNYFKNSVLVTVCAVFIILFLSSLAAFILAKHDIPFKKYLIFFFAIGLFLPYKLGSITVVKMMLNFGLYNSRLSLLAVYAAMGIPFGVFVLTDFIKGIPDDLINSAKLDGCSGPRIYYMIVLPLIKSALITVAVLQSLHVWNDFWYPLILIKSERLNTIPLAVAKITGYIIVDNPKVFAVLGIASLPMIIFYLFLSKYYVRGVYGGALK